MIVLFGNDS